MSTPTATPSIDEYRAVQKVIWDSGDFDTVAKQLIWAEGPVAIEAAGIAAGDKVLDVACGTGNVAIRAQGTGATVTGLDIAPELLDAARANASEAGAEVEFVEGDAAELPFEDASFDVVTSVFGAQFAPRQHDVAAEIGRVLRPGGRIALINWTPAGFIGQMLKTLGPFMPAPPEFVKPPPTWGVPEHVSGLFEDTGIKLESKTGNAGFTNTSSEGFLDFMTTHYGPTFVAKAKLTDAGKWDEAHAALLEVTNAFNTSEDGFEAASEYLLTTGSKQS